jgi:nanoRNase/pAp phosphatase (c-di-AMP/oligoRNAs hydrolase)
MRSGEGTVVATGPLSLVNRSNVATTQEERSDNPSLLLMISDVSDLDASTRSAHRKVYRWSTGAHGESDSPADGTFHGDPTRPETYGWLCDARAVTAVVHLRDDTRANAVIKALRDVRPDAAMLVLSEALDEAPGDGTMVRAGELRDVLRLDLEDELLRLESERRGFCLRRFAEGCPVLPILVHPDPDPDALSSALAVRTFLGRNAANAPILTTLLMRRPENRRMAQLLDLHLTEATAEEVKAYDRIIVVDMQPSQIDLSGARLAVIDHHPPESEYRAEHIDVRPEYGAVATMITEYLRAQGEGLIDAPLATALLYGIKTDTDSLTRGVSAADVNAYAHLQSLADPALLRRIQRPSYPANAARGFGRALNGLFCDGGLAVAFAGTLTKEESHILADLADFCMEIQGVSRAAAAAIVEDQLIVTLRDLGDAEGVAGIARIIGEKGGSGGGHPTMARAAVPLEALDGWTEDDAVEYVERMVREAEQMERQGAGEEKGEMVSRRS